MDNFLQSFLKSSKSRTSFIKPNKGVEDDDQLRQSLVYRDELNKKKTAPYKVKKRVHFESKLADEKKIVNSETSAACIKVKVLMTKQEAARLLSKCKDGENCIGFKDVANELFQIPDNRVIVVSSSSSAGKKDI